MIFQWGLFAWFKVNPPNVVRVGSSHRCWEIGPQILHTCFMKPYRSVNGRCLFSSRQTLVLFLNLKFRVSVNTCLDMLRLHKNTYLPRRTSA